MSSIRTRHRGFARSIFGPLFFERRKPDRLFRFRAAFLFGHDDVFFALNRGAPVGHWDQWRSTFLVSFFSLMELDAYDLAHAMLLHGHAVKDVGHADGALIMGDDDELRMREEALQHLDETVDV